MEKGLYSMAMIKDLILKQTKQFLYYAQNDPYDNLVEIEISFENTHDDGIIVQMHRFYTRGEITNLPEPRLHLIPFKDYKYIRKKSQFL